jgi:hypothetical protein
LTPVGTGMGLLPIRDMSVKVVVRYQI